MANGKVKESTVQQVQDIQWEEFKKQITSIIYTFGAILFTPIIILVALGYGLKAGILVTVEKTLALLKGWEV